MINRNLCKTVIDKGGSLTPLIIPSKETNGIGVMNPSIFLDNDKLYINLRHINYILYHSEGEQLFFNRYGPLVYMNPEDDIKLKTTNYLCTLDTDLSVKDYYKVNTSKLDIPAVWDFHGLEDARLVKWDDKLYLSGVRRDVKDNGEGRIELSEIDVSDKSVSEVSRLRIPAPGDNTSYCEKNWMPVIDLPYTYVKWTNPTEVVKVDTINKTCNTIFISDNKISFETGDLRGGSQVIPYGEFYIALVHEVRLWKNRLSQKDATYYHRFIIWDKQWNIVRVSDLFSFMTGEIEFACGMTFYKGDLLITFGFQDNASYLLKIPHDIIDTILYDKL